MAARFRGKEAKLLGGDRPAGTAKSTMFQSDLKEQRHAYHKGVISTRMFFEPLPASAWTSNNSRRRDFTPERANNADIVMSLCDTEIKQRVRYAKENLGKGRCCGRGQ